MEGAGIDPAKASPAWNCWEFHPEHRLIVDEELPGATNPRTFVSPAADWFDRRPGSPVGTATIRSVYSTI